jgi:hypothetical protein
MEIDAQSGRAPPLTSVNGESRMPAQQRILKTMVPLDDGTHRKVDTIEHEDKLWLVAFWIETPGVERRMPGRLIRLDTLQHYASQAGGAYGDFLLNTPVPRRLFDREPLTPPPEGFEVIERPDIAL